MNPALPFTLDSIRDIVKTYPTPFHIYDEARIRFISNNLKTTMLTNGVKEFQNYFAVKALPNPEIIKILVQEGMGVDCSSLAELAIAEMCGLSGEQIMFTSNNTTDEEFRYASQLNAIINFDDKTLVEHYLDIFGTPQIASCRFNPGDIEFGSINESIIGSPKEAKYGMPANDLVESYRALKLAGVTKFGLHTMLLSNELDWHNHELIVRELFKTAKQIAEQLDIKFEFINLGGGIGVPYRPTENPFELDIFASKLSDIYNDMDMSSIGSPRIVMENGRYVTADSGYVVTEVINHKNTHKKYIGVDASMSDLMRPGMYDAYHHVSILGKESQEVTEEVDIVGSLCENNDKFAINRLLPKTDIGDILVIHTTGAHGHAMGFQYNGKLRHAELLLDPGGRVKLIRRAETLDDYFETLIDKGDYNVPTN